MYTKGEWHIGGRSRRDITIGADDKIIAEVWINELQPEAEANARLIVSAVNACVKLNPDKPMAVAESISDLYEALKVLNGHPELYGRLSDKDRNKMRKALAKAEGK